MRRDTKLRVWLYAIFGAVVAFLLFGVIIPRTHRVRQAQRTVDMLRLQLARDPRFTQIHIAWGTIGGVFMEGTVRSESDLQALELLVHEAHPPCQPKFSVRVSPLTE